MDEIIRDKLLSADLLQITAATRKLVQDYGQLMEVDVEQKYKEGLLSDRTYKVLMAGLR